MSQAALHVCHEKVQRLLTKKESLWELEISLFKCNPQDFLQEINYSFVFCNLKAAISTFLRYSRRPK